MFGIELMNGKQGMLGGLNRIWSVEKSLSDREFSLNRELATIRLAMLFCCNILLIKEKI